MLTELEFQGGVGEAEAVLGDAVTTGTPLVAPEGEFVLFVDAVALVDGQVIGAEAAQVDTHHVPGIAGVEVQGRLGGGMAQVGVVFAILGWHILALIVVMGIFCLFTVTLALEVEETAGDFGILGERLVGLAVLGAHHVLGCERHARGDQCGDHGGTQGGALEDHFFHLLLLLILWT